MSDLTPEDQALLARARDGLSPGPEDHARIKRRVLVQIAAGTVAATAALSTSAEAAVATGAGVFSGLAKIVLVGVLGTAVVTGAVGVGVVANRPPSNPPAPTSLERVATAAVPVETEPVRAVPSPSSLADDAPPPVIVDRPAAAPASTAPPLPPSRPKASAEPTPVASAQGPASVPMPAQGPSTLMAETALLRQADAALKSGDAARALDLIDQHAASFPGGVLVEEREAERVVVLCALGRADDARLAGSVFLRDHPRSTQAARVRASCGSP